MPSFHEQALTDAQRAIEDQGFLIICAYRLLETGSILDRFGVRYGDQETILPGPLFVVGAATEEDFETQHFNLLGCYPQRSYPFYYKVMAE